MVDGGYGGSQASIRVIYKLINELFAVWVCLETSLAVPKNRVCFVYDERMALHRNVAEP